MKKKIKTILKIIVLILVIYLLCFIVFFGNKLIKYQKLVSVRKALFESESYKVIKKEEKTAPEYPESLRIGSKKGDKVAFEISNKYEEEIKTKDPLIKDNNLTIYYEKDPNSSSPYRSHQVFVNNDEKSFSIVESGMYMGTMAESLYPQAISLNFLSTGEETLLQKYWYLTTIIPMINSMKFYETTDEGREAFVAEEEKTAFSGGDDREYTRMRTYYDKDTMIAYKQTKIKPDGTEKLMSRIEVELNSVTEEDVSVPDLSTYRQILEE